MGSNHSVPKLTTPCMVAWEAAWGAAWGAVLAVAAGREAGLEGLEHATIRLCDPKQQLFFFLRFVVQGGTWVIKEELSSVPYMCVYTRVPGHTSLSLCHHFFVFVVMERG